MNMNHYMLDSDGKVVPTDDVVAWAEWFEKAGNGRLVDRTVVGKAFVSTVFLGLDHSYAGSGPPILWETLVFGGPQDGYMERYASVEAAREGHAKAVAMLKAQARREEGPRWQRALVFLAEKMGIVKKSA